MLKKAIKFTAAILPLAFIAGVTVTQYEMAAGVITAEMMQGMSVSQIYLMVTLQTVVYAVFCGMAGYFLADKTGLIQCFQIKWEKLKWALFAGALCGALFFTIDYLVFGKMIPQVTEFYQSYPFSISYLLSEVFYGGVVEELLLRWFLMSLMIFLLWKVFARKRDKKSIPIWIMVVSNIVVAGVFAAGHLPATIAMFGSLNVVILLRCFLLNGSFGIVFGRLYRKYGIQYAMVAHALIHLVCDGLLYLFVK